MDAWFIGFSTRIACGVWVGLDARKTLYPGADGCKVALPIWVDFMKAALPSTPREAFPEPDGMEWAKAGSLGVEQRVWGVSRPPAAALPGS